MKFLKKLSILTRPSITKEICGEKFTFYPVSLSMFGRVIGELGPILKTLAAVFQKQDFARASAVEETRDPMNGALLTRVEHTSELPASEATRIAEQRQKSIDEAVQALTSGKNRLLLAALLADSLRDEFEQGIPDADQLSAFIDSPAMTLDVVGHFMAGWAEVNAGVFGPLARRLLGDLKSKLQQRLHVPEGSAPESL